MIEKIFLLILAPILFIYCSSNYYSDKELNGAYTGIIDSIYMDDRNHSVMTFKIKIDDKKSITIVSEFYPRSWEYAIVGDSIIKNKGESFITIKKKDGNLTTKSFETKFKKRS